MQTELEILRNENQSLLDLLSRKDSTIEKLEEEIRLHLLARFGKRSEAFVNPDQPSLFNEIETDADKSSVSSLEDNVAVGPYEKKKGHRKALSTIFPRERVEHDLSEDEKTCSVHGLPLVRIGEDISEQLEIIPEQIKVIQHVRHKYKCPCCDGNFKQSPMPPQPIPKSMATASLLAYICVSKYVDHLPLYRIEKKFARIYVHLPRATLSRWMIKISELLTPLYNLLQDDLLSSDLIQMDETVVQVLKEPGRDPSSNSYMWVRAREEKTGPPIILYDYFPSRGTKVINELLMDYCGILQTDGYKSYDSYTQNRDIIHAGCLAHCRRKFWEAFKASKKAKDSYAEQGLKWIKAIYKIEAETKQMTVEQRLAHRVKFMAPIMSNFKEWLDASINKVPSSLKTGEAMQYLQGQWPKLQNVFKDGRLPLDTNFIESKIRPFTIGRKNWLFSDTPKGAHASALIYSILETARANNIEPFSYLEYVLKHIPAAESVEEVAALLPKNYAKKDQN